MTGSLQHRGRALSGGISNTVFRDNIRDNRLIPVSDGIVSVINTYPFQRLRSIRQMGLSSFVFPTAEHSRFAHSLGVYGTAKETFVSLRLRSEALGLSFPGMRFDHDEEREFCLASMCHDIGHTAYSHVLEGNLLPSDLKNHEACTLQLIENDPELKTSISNYADLEAVLLLIKGTHPNRALSQLVSGVFDLDRSDYLVRDSHNAGVQYGRFDTQWLLHALTVGVNRLDQPILLLDGGRGVDALRQFLAARRHMYRQVYYQPTIRAGQLLLKGIFERIADRGIDGRLHTACPKGLRSATNNEPISIEDFLHTTDVEVNALIRMLAMESRDELLKELCQRFWRRKFPKSVLDSGKSHRPLSVLLGVDLSRRSKESDELTYLPLDFKEEVDLVRECRDIVSPLFEGDGLPPGIADYLVRSETINFSSYPQTDIVVSYKDGQVALDTGAGDEDCVSFPELAESFQLYRLYVPDEYRDAVNLHIQALMRRKGSL